MEPDCCKDSDCQANQVCTSGSCVDACQPSCQSWQTCDQGTCTPECKEDSHCSADEYCSSSESCEAGCRESEACGNCGTCSNHQCVEPDCCLDSDCQDNQVCTSGSCFYVCDPSCHSWQTCDEGACTPDCKEDNHCNADEYCSSSGSCEAGCRGSGACGECGTCSDHQCIEPECCINSDCQDNQMCTNGSCEYECVDNSDCELGHYCSEHQCTKGCSDDNGCEACDTCVNNECQHPECCPETVESDCTDPYKPICESNECVPKPGSCKSDEECEGWNAACNSDYSNCQYCNHDINICEAGCYSNDNCDGYNCNNNHTCSTGVQSITLKTHSCTGCQGAQGNTDEDGPFVILVGDNFASCNTQQLDHPDKIDFDNGKTSVFSEESLLQACYKIDLADKLIGGSIHWTSRQGEWKPKNGQVEISFSTGDSDCCCLSKPAINNQDTIASFKNCARCATHPGC
eukprot:TRINITY_DN11999_c0_g1_i12.p1 TRINITY_DN11999_c0_g1~~TRINITY_DN11999_c0_g1_i12.p1  ORF type:complete len:459 (-),score=44.03 TRINITY_DN11999_c0_g1_i12:92-1468(-)